MGTMGVHPASHGLLMSTVPLSTMVGIVSARLNSGHDVSRRPDGQ